MLHGSKTRHKARHGYIISDVILQANSRKWGLSMVKTKQDIKADLEANLKRSGVSFPDKLAAKIYRALPRHLKQIDNRGGFFVSEIKNHPPRFRSKSTEFSKFLVALLLTFPEKTLYESIEAAKNCFNWTYKEYTAVDGAVYKLKTGKQIYKDDVKAGGGGVIFFTDTDSTTQIVDENSIYLVATNDSSNIYSLE